MDEQRDNAKIIIADAWYEYLHETQGIDRDKYAQVEVWAWARLQARLGNLQVKRARVA